MRPDNECQSKLGPGVRSVGLVFVAAVLLFFGFNFKSILYHNLGEVELHKAILSTSNLEKHLRAAEDAFQKALKKDSTRAESWLGLGKVYCLQRRYQEAERALETYRDLRSSDDLYVMDWLIAQGQKQVKQSQHEDAEEMARLTFAVSAETAAGYFALGEIYKRMARWEEAASAYQKAVELEPQHVPAYFNLCWAQLKLGKRQEAVACYQELAKTSNENDLYYIYSNLGSIYGVWCTTNCNYELALTYFRQMFAVARSENKKAEYYALSGYVYYRQGELPEAIARLEEAVALRPDYPQYHLWLADAYRDNGQLEKALAEYQKALELRPEDEHARQEVEKLLEKEEL